MIHLAPVRTVAPTVDLLTVEEIKAALRIDHSDEDAWIATARNAVTEHLDGYTGILGQCLLNQTWRQNYCGFPADGVIRLPVGPVSTVSDVTYRDTSDAQQTLAGGVYAGPLVDAVGPYLKLKFAQVWPATYERDDAVSVTFVAGYGSAASSVPARIKQAALLMIGDLYEHRETVVIGVSAMQIPMSASVSALIANDRRIGI